MNVRDNFTPFDAELCVMVNSLTGTQCEPQDDGECFSIIVDYSKRPEPDFIAAVMAAIEGRAGERFDSFEDYPEKQYFKARIKFSKEQMPFCYGDERDKREPDLDAGETYCGQYSQLKALQVRRTNLEGLQRFVGGGEMHIPRCPGCPATFHFLNGSVFLDVKEGDYICAGKVAFFVIKEAEFELSYQPAEQ